MTGRSLDDYVRFLEDELSEAIEDARRDVRLLEHASKAHEEARMGSARTNARRLRLVAELARMRAEMSGRGEEA